MGWDGHLPSVHVPRRPETHLDKKKKEVNILFTLGGQETESNNTPKEKKKKFSVNT